MLTLGTLSSIALMILGAFQLPAEAHIVTLEPDAYVAGTDVSNAWAHEGITMRSVFGDPPLTTGPVYSSGVVNQPAFTGSRMFAPRLGGSTTWGAINDVPGCYTDPTFPCSNLYPDSYAALHITFERPVDFVEAFGVWSIDWLGMKFLGADGRVLGVVYSPNQLYTDGIWLYGSTQVQRESRDIYGVILGGVIGGSSIDMIRVNVPEPSAMALFSLGLLGIGIARQRKSRTGDCAAAR